MAAETPPFVLQAGSHPAETVRRFVHGTMGGRGGIVGYTDLAVTQNGTPNMSVNVAAGEIFVAGTESANQGLYYGENRSTLNVSIAASDPTNARRDLIVARVRDAAYSGATNTFTIEAVTGTPAGTPADPTLPANCWVLARIAVSAGATSIGSLNITDLRMAYLHASTNVLQQAKAAALGGITVCRSTARPTAGLTFGTPIYEDDTRSLYFYNGSGWDLFSSAPTSWVSPALSNSWVNFGGAFQAVSYRRVGDIVQMRGSAKNGTTTTGTTIYTLPAGYRPPATHIFATLDGNNNAARFDVDSSGNVTIQTGTNACFTLRGEFSVNS